MKNRNVYRICSETGNKRSGYNLSDPKNIQNIIKSINDQTIFIGAKFKIGSHEYLVNNIFIDGVYGDFEYETIDEGMVLMNAYIWICCKTEDERIKENNLTDENEKSFLDDIMNM